MDAVTMLYALEVFLPKHCIGSDRIDPAEQGAAPGSPGQNKKERHIVPAGLFGAL